MKLLKTGLSLRGDYYYCPLALTLSTYWNCEPHCIHCYLRRLNRTWGEDLRPLDIEVLKKQIHITKRKYNENNYLAKAINMKKTVYIGSKSDPYQDSELEYKITRDSIKLLLKNNFSIVIATMFTNNMKRDLDIYDKYKPLITIMPIVSPGIDKDWRVLEKKKTTRASARIKDASELSKLGFHVGINGEPFIPNYHTLKDFEITCEMLRDYGLDSYNTYNLHMNDWNAKRMFEAGLDIEAIWEGNQDSNWRKILLDLIKISKKYKIKLGCPDFVNSGKYIQPTNTCCGIDVPNPIRFNLITWKDMKLKGRNNSTILEDTWEGIGDLKEGKRLIEEKDRKIYTLKDIEEEQ